MFRNHFFCFFISFYIINSFHYFISCYFSISSSSYIRQFLNIFLVKSNYSLIYIIFLSFLFIQFISFFYCICYFTYNFPHSIPLHRNFLNSILFLKSIILIDFYCFMLLPARSVKLYHRTYSFNFILIVIIILIILIINIDIIILIIINIVIILIFIIIINIVIIITGIILIIIIVIITDIILIIIITGVILIIIIIILIITGIMLFCNAWKSLL